MRSRLLFLLIIFSLLFSSKTVFADCAISSLLKVGSKGAEVGCLQGKVGAVADGSFGPLTKIAVIVFQSNHGLAADGIVGPLSSAVLNGFLGITASGGNYPAGCTGTTGYSTTTGLKCDGGSDPLAPNLPQNQESVAANSNNTQITNPNLNNLDHLVSTVVSVSKKMGVNDEKIKVMTESLRTKIINSNIDYNKKFIDLLISESQLSVNDPSNAFSEIIKKSLSFLGITPRVAQAQSGIPFGTDLLISSFECLNFQWMLDMKPLPPTNVVLLSYIIGTQGFANHNIPFTTNLLGTYTNFGECVIDYYPYLSIPTEGTISPMVGSS